ncbi:hypothetical protein LSCM4_04188 [Leishmania orientalis]|uniref:Uncharacterized protein n=1 Tax=Leishmania orientalis TaxID=2249476 RepID=A0A836GIC0_9TRYP|nr:hypothetical protein LSCM4_04188 [Leishmania orientalis]
MFDPTRSKGDINERFAECSMRVVQYAFEARECGASETMLYMEEVMTSLMAKRTRAQTAQRWRPLIESRQCIPRFPRGLNTGFEELHSTTRTFRVVVDAYYHTPISTRKHAPAIWVGSRRRHTSSHVVAALPGKARE